jgi:hypothetical protein
VQYNSAGTPVFPNVGISGLSLAGKGIISRVMRDPGGANPYWYVQNSGVLRSVDGVTFTALSGTPPSFAGMGTYLSRVFSVKSIYANDTSIPQQRYFFFLNYGLGYLVFDYISSTGLWSSVNNLDFSEYDSLYKYEPFLLDVEQDALINASQFRKISTNYTGNKQWLFFATKIGLFYVNELALLDFANGDKEAGINKFKKIINIPNPYNPKESVLITKVKVIGNTVYLGSKQGVYTVDKTGTEWNKFVYDSVDDFTYYDLQSIKKVEEFIYEEPVVSMDLTSTTAGQVLCIATPKRVWFKNISNGKTDMVTVWDGLPFVPIFKYASAKLLNEVDFKTHDAASVNFTLWDAVNSKFWIGTDYGLCSVDISRLNIQ